MTRPPRGARQDPREVAELRALAERQPELSPAATLQIELVNAQRRIQTRTSTAAVVLSDEELATRLASGQPLIDFDRLPIEWNEARLLFRQVTDVLRRHDALDSAVRRTTARRRPSRGAARTRRAMVRPRHQRPLDRDARRGARVVAAAVSDAHGRSAAATRCVRRLEAWGLPGVRRRARLRVHHHDRGATVDLRPLPDALADRTVRLPVLRESDRQRITSFATPDGTYRVTACQTCRRYLKTLDGRAQGAR